MQAKAENRVPAVLQPAVQNAARVLASALILVIGLVAVFSGGPLRESAIESPSHSTTVLRIDINQAGQQEWILMPNIGRSTAQQILKDRAANGPFRSLADLQRVPGIGPKTVRELSPYCQAVTSAAGPESKQVALGP
ncbi:MAG: helix-hairpin-helix domain-containing protein [Planctomycetales bacterium]|nr:helix-hairpin-helix domain-containing protein [Planctomycetales bacterium]